MAQVMQPTGIFIFPIVVVVLSSVLYYLREFALVFNLVGSILWLVLISLMRTPVHQKNNAMLTILTATSVISLAVFAISELRQVPQQGIYWIVGLFMLVGVADSAAYFTGRRFGKRKLAPHISPGKTKEGLIGSLLTVWVMALAAGAVIWSTDYAQMLSFACICLVCAIFSVIGDLFMSLQKRKCDVKDSGILLPGHGGILDRIDSTLAVAPVYALCMKTFLL